MKLPIEFRLEDDTILTEYKSELKAVQTLPELTAFADRWRDIYQVPINITQQILDAKLDYVKRLSFEPHGILAELLLPYRIMYAIIRSREGGASVNHAFAQINGITMMTEREKDLHLKVVCITARLMMGTKFDSPETRAEYRSNLDDQIESLDDYVIDLLAENLKVAELYDVVDLNSDNAPQTDGMKFVCSYHGHDIHYVGEQFIVGKGDSFVELTFPSVDACKNFIEGK